MVSGMYLERRPRGTLEYDQCENQWLHPGIDKVAAEHEVGKEDGGAQGHRPGAREEATTDENQERDRPDHPILEEQLTPGRIVDRVVHRVEIGLDRAGAEPEKRGVYVREHQVAEQIERR